MRKNLLITTALVAVAFSLPVYAAEAQSINEPRKIIDNDTIFEKLTTTVGQNAGALTIGNAGSVTIGENVKFLKNSSTNSGGAMKALSGFEIGNDVRFEENSSKKAGGALYIRLSPDSGKTDPVASTIAKIGNNAKFINNKTNEGWLGGAIAVEYAPEGLIIGENAEFTGNSAKTDGGAIAIWTSENNNITDKKITVVTLGKGATFTRNTANTGDTEKNRGGAVYNAAIANFDGATFTENEARLGGAIYNGDPDNRGNNSGTLSIKNSTFSNNKTGAKGYGGAIFNQRGILTVENSIFDNNHATWDGGAISSNSSYIKDKTREETREYWKSVNGFDAANKIVISNSTFSNNQVDEYSGGALGIYSDATITNSEFTNNNAGGHTPTDTVDGGGAIYVGGWGRLNIDNSTFDNNSSNIGGAIGTTHAGLSGDESVSVKNSTFKNNKATDEGGAIANGFTKFTIENSVFTENTANKEGGAIRNIVDRTIVLSGTNTFSGNKANGVLNDIHNLGNINVSGSLELDGGISGNGTTTFAKDSTLTVNTGTTKIANKVVNEGATLNLKLDNGFTGNYQMVTGSLDKEFTITENNLYNIVADTSKAGTYNISKKSSDEVAAAVGATGNQASAITAVTSGNTANTTFNQIAENINSLMQSGNSADVKTALDASTALAPEVAPAVQSASTETTNQVFGAVGTRLSGGSISTGSEGMSSGDNIFERVAVWVQGLFNKSKLDDTSKAKGFDADSNGVAFGVEKYVTDDTKLGIGYAYTNTDIDGFMRKTDVDTHTAIVYGEYKPSRWFVNGIATYGWSDYSENKNVAGVGVNADYDVDTFGLQVMTGYEMNINGFGVTPEAGLRYVHIKQDSYKDSADQKVSANDSDILTGVIGAKISKNFELSNGVNLKPEARVAATYDLKNDDVNSVVTLANGAAYAVEGKALKRFGMEFGAGVTAEVNDSVELSLGYEGKFREDYQDHTGLINAKYKF